MFSFQLFSKPKLVSIGLLLAILFISLMFSSYTEGLDTIDTVNKDAPKDAVAKAVAKDAVAKDAVAKDPSMKPMDGINLSESKTKLLSVTDITGTLKNNPGVQKMLEKPNLGTTPYSSA